MLACEWQNLQSPFHQSKIKTLSKLLWWWENGWIMPKMSTFHLTAHCSGSLCSLDSILIFPFEILCAIAMMLQHWKLIRQFWHSFRSTPICYNSKQNLCLSWNQQCNGFTSNPSCVLSLSWVELILSLSLSVQSAFICNAQWNFIVVCK